MTTFDGHAAKLPLNLNTLLLTLEVIFLFVLFKDINFSIFFILVLFSLPLIYRFPEFGLAIALTGRLLLHFIFDYAVIGLPFPALILYLIILLGGALMIMLHGPLPSSLPIKMPQVLTLILFVVLLFGTLYTKNPLYASQKLFFYLLFNIILVFFPLLIAKDIAKVEHVFLFTYLLGVLLGIITTFIALNTSAALRFQPSESINPIWFSRSLGISFLASIYVLNKVKRRFFKLLIVATYPLFIIPMLRSWSRGPLLGIFFCWFLYYFFQPHISKKRKLAAALLILISSAAFLFLTSNQIVARLQMPLSEEMSAAFRLLAWIESAKLFAANPLLGIGTGSFFINFPFNPFYYPHNIFLEVACENGIIGMAVFCAFLFFTIKLAFRTIKNSTGKLVQISVMSLTLFFYALWNALLSGDISTNENIWLAAGLISATALSLEIKKRMDNEAV